MYMYNSLLTNSFRYCGINAISDDGGVAGVVMLMGRKSGGGGVAWAPVILYRLM